MVHKGRKKVINILLAIYIFGLIVALGFASHLFSYDKNLDQGDKIVTIALCVVWPFFLGGIIGSVVTSLETIAGGNK